MTKIKPRRAGHGARQLRETVAGLNHLLAGAGNINVMTTALRHMLCDHAADNYRILIAMSTEFMAAAAQREPPRINDNVVIHIHIHTCIDDPPSGSTTAQRRASPTSPLQAPVASDQAQC